MRRIDDVGLRCKSICGSIKTDPSDKNGVLVVGLHFQEIGLRDIRGAIFEGAATSGAITRNISVLPQHACNVIGIH